MLHADTTRWSHAPGNPVVPSRWQATDGTWPTHQSATHAIFEYIESDYNLRRRHSTLGQLSPAAYEATATPAEAQVA
jgi:transposase InsO family protein